MHRPESRPGSILTILIVLAVVASAVLCGAVTLSCAPRRMQVRSSVIDYLYPKGKSAEPPRDVTLRVPVRVGLAFAPSQGGWAGSQVLTEDAKAGLLETIAGAFRGRDTIADIQTIPSTYVKAEGGFEDLDRIAATFGIDLAVLLSFEQAQFSESGAASLAYWTLIGAYIVKGEKNETRTVVDAAVFDVTSRTLLFTATGESRVGGSATPVGAQRALRLGSEEGFRLAVERLVPKLDAALAEFQKQAATGTVRGPGTPAITIASGGGEAQGQEGGGAAGLVELSLATLIAASGWRSWRRRKP